MNRREEALVRLRPLIHAANGDAMQLATSFARAIDNSAALADPCTQAIVLCDVMLYITSGS